MNQILDSFEEQRERTNIEHKGVLLLFIIVLSILNPVFIHFITNETGFMNLGWVFTITSYTLFMIIGVGFLLSITTTIGWILNFIFNIIRLRKLGKFILTISNKIKYMELLLIAHSFVLGYSIYYALMFT